MPIYEYRCENGHTFEVMQRMSDDALTECSECGAPLHRVFHPVAIHFKGSGFYNTDYGRKNRGGSGDGDGAPSESGKDAKKEPATSTAKADSKTPAKADSKTSAKAD
ncbi:MAG: FmdB family zinc ribbon protein [Thermoleophilaceae bacterium]